MAVGCRPCVIDPHGWCSGCGHVFACQEGCEKVGQVRESWKQQWTSHSPDCPNRPGKDNVMALSDDKVPDDGANSRFEELTTCMRCGARGPNADLIGNLTTFWRGDTYGVQHPTFCSPCIGDIRRFVETPIKRGGPWFKGELVQLGESYGSLGYGHRFRVFEPVDLSSRDNTVVADMVGIWSIPTAMLIGCRT